MFYIFKTQVEKYYPNLTLIHLKFEFAILIIALSKVKFKPKIILTLRLLNLVNDVKSGIVSYHCCLR